MSKSKLILLLVLLMLLGGFLRLYKLAEYPVSLNTDEVTFGYTAYSVLKTGKDEWGKFLPVTFRSVGDYKNPVPVYLVVASISIFGLNEFGVRLPFALVAILAIPVFYFLWLQITKSKLIAAIAASLLAISPWHIFYSRFGNDGPMGMVVACLGLALMLRFLERSGKILAIVSAFFLILSMYTYYSERLFIPLIVLIFLGLNFKKIKQKPKDLIVFIISCLIFVAPLLFMTLFGPDAARADMVFVGKDIDFRRYVMLDQPLTSFQDYLSLAFFAAKRFLNYLQPDFLFFTGLNLTLEGSLGMGLFYLFELPFFILGTVELIKGRYKYRWLVLIWVIVAIFPAALTNNEQNPGRTIIALPMLLLINALGILAVVKFIKGLKSRGLQNAMFALYGGFIVLVLAQAFLVYSIHWPLDRSEFSFKGNKEAVLQALSQKEKYQEIIFDPFRGVATPNLYGLPEYYILFYSQYDPATYQNEKHDFNGVNGFDKFRIRKIYWPDDRFEKDTLFVGSPWSLPLKDIKEEEILKKIYLSNGDLALLVVAPKPSKD